jgi:hypothetical protein
MRRVRFCRDGAIVAHLEIYTLPGIDSESFSCIPPGFLSEENALAIAEAIDRGEVVGQSGEFTWQAFVETAVPVQPQRTRSQESGVSETI